MSDPEQCARFDERLDALKQQSELRIAALWESLNDLRTRVAQLETRLALLCLAASALGSTAGSTIRDALLNK